MCTILINQVTSTSLKRCQNECALVDLHITQWRKKWIVCYVLKVGPTKPSQWRLLKSQRRVLRYKRWMNWLRATFNVSFSIVDTFFSCSLWSLLDAWWFMAASMGTTGIQWSRLNSCYERRRKSKLDGEWKARRKWYLCRFRAELTSVSNLLLQFPSSVTRGATSPRTISSYTLSFTSHLPFFSSSRLRHFTGLLC